MSVYWVACPTCPWCGSLHSDLACGNRFGGPITSLRLQREGSPGPSGSSEPPPLSTKAHVAPLLWRSGNRTGTLVHTCYDPPQFRVSRFLRLKVAAFSTHAPPKTMKVSPVGPVCTSTLPFVNLHDVTTAPCQAISLKASEKGEG